MRQRGEYERERERERKPTFCGLLLFITWDREPKLLEGMMVPEVDNI